MSKLFYNFVRDISLLALKGSLNEEERIRRKYFLFIYRSYPSGGTTSIDVFYNFIKKYKM